MARVVTTDRTEAALRQLRRMGESVADSCDMALGAYRADADHETRCTAICLHLRRAERLARDMIDHIQRVSL